MAEPLKPCPFCGGDPVGPFPVGKEGCGMGMRIGCPECDVSLTKRTGLDPAAVTRAWNHRHQQPEPEVGLAHDQECQAGPIPQRG